MLWKSGYWSRACCAPKHMVDKYTSSVNDAKTKMLDWESLISIPVIDIIQFKYNNFYEDVDGNHFIKESLMN